MATNWRVYGKETVACKLDRADLPGFFRKKIVVGPHEAAIVVKDGRVHEAITEAKFKTGGLFDGLARILGGGADLEVFFVDLSPINFSVYLGSTTKAQSTTAASTNERTVDASQYLTADLIAASHRVGWVEQTEGHGEMSAGGTASIDISEVNIVAMTLDQEVVNAECRFRLCVDPEETRQFISLVKGKTALATWDIAALIRDELLARVLVPEIASRRADEIRGNRQLMQGLEEQVNNELRRTFAGCGLILESFAINWGLTEQELAEIARKRAERAEQALKFTHQRQLTHMSRAQEIEKTRLTNLQELKVAQGDGNEELKDLLLAGEIRRDLMAEGKQVDLAKVDAQVRSIQLDTDKMESMARLEQRRADEQLRLDIEDREFKQQQTAKAAEMELEQAAKDADAAREDKEMWSMVKMQIQMATSKHERTMAERRQEIDSECRKQQAAIEDRYQQRKLRLEEDRERMGMQERIVSQAISDDTANADVVKTLLEQATEQSALNASDAKVQARSEAKAAASNLNTYQQAEDRERQHQKDMTGLASDMMQASKQAPGSTVVTGGRAAPAPQAPVNIVNAPAAPQPAPAPSPTAQCSSCGGDLQAGWKACPACGVRLDGKCAECGAELQDGWKACPNCGTKR